MSAVPDVVVDVVVIGDGPAGSALAAACSGQGLAAALVGPDAPWTNTYATWVDELDLDAEEVLAEVLPSMAVHADGSSVLDRAYGVVDNDRLRLRLRTGVDHRVGHVVDVGPGATGRVAPRHTVVVDDGTRLDAAVVVDATGWPGRFAGRLTPGPAPAWQTAMGVVLARPPEGDLGRPTFMDFRPVGSDRGGASSIGPEGVATFCYCLPVPDGWLVEETVLAARPSVEPIALLPRLAARLGRHPDAVLAEAVRTEYVRIPMGGRRPRSDQPVVAFGAAAGYVHPATGFSVAASLRAAPRVATAVAEALDARGASAGVDVSAVAEAVWPASMRRTRVLHDYGLETMLKLEPAEVREFFGAFFALDDDLWPSYLRLDAPPAEVSRVMAELFRSVSWPMRRRLMAANPVTFAKLLRP